MLAFALAFAAAPRRAAADGKKDFQEGVAAYEDLDTDKAVEKFKSAVKSADLPNGDKALAYLYLGMVEFESGREKEAYDWWKKGFALDPNAQAPKGTSPKTISALEAAREDAASKPATPTPPIGKPPSVEPQPPGPQVTPPPAAPEEEKKGVPGWVLWGGIGAAAVIGGVVAAVVIASGGGACNGDGGCASIDVNIP